MSQLWQEARAVAAEGAKVSQDLESLLLAIAAALGIAGGGITLLSKVLPWARKVVPAIVAVTGAVDASKDRLIVALQAENTELDRQLKACRERGVEADKRAEAADARRAQAAGEESP